MNAFERLAESVFADSNLSIPAQFRHPPYTWQSCRVILSQPTDITGAARSGTLMAELRASAITDTPQRGDELRIGATTYAVEDAERDVQALSWKLTLSEPAAD